LFDLNICMEVRSEKDFTELRQYLNKLSKRFPMFRHDVAQIERIVEEHIKNHSIALVHYRQSKQKTYMERAQSEIVGINRVLSTVGKIELMAMLSQG
jgi:hypothetical protein